MHTHFLSLRKAVFFIRRSAVLFCGLATISFGSVLSYRSNMGLGPWDVLHQGLSLHLPVSFGQASIVVGVLVVLLGFLLGIRPGFGTICNMILCGVFVDTLLHANWLINLPHQAIILRLLADILGILVMGVGTALYIAPHLGAGPRDGLMLRLHTLTHRRIALVRAGIECSALLLGILLGGSFGIGTFLFALGIGPAVEWSGRGLEAIRVHSTDIAAYGRRLVARA
ncbi:MAG: membrane protein [Ktedonobacteraceae bacterium]